MANAPSPDQLRALRDVQEDYDQVRQILAADITVQPSTKPLPDLPGYVGGVAFAVYGLVSEVRQLRAQVAALSPVEAPRTGEDEPAVNDYLNNGLVFCGYHHRALKDRACPECSSARPRTQGAEG